MNIGQELEDFVYNWKTKYKEGFMPDELKEITEKFPQLHMDKWENAMMGNTCMMYEGKFCIYHCDVLNALRAGLQNHELKITEWD